MIRIKITVSANNSSSKESILILNSPEIKSSYSSSIILLKESLIKITMDASILRNLLPQSGEDQNKKDKYSLF